MTEALDLADYETPLTVRQATEADIPSIIALQERCFPGMTPWKAEDLRRHQQTFPTGQVVAVSGDAIVGSASSLIVDLGDFGEAHTYKEVTGNGSFDTHDPEGPDLYGAEVMVDSEWRGMSIGERLYDARKELCEEANLRRIVIAGRMPGYQDHADTMSARQYVDAVRNGRLDDPVLGFQIRQDFVPKRIIRDYIPNDHESQGYAVLMEWSNIEHRPSGKRVTKASEPVRVCVIQYKMRRLDGFEAFAQQTQYFADIASNYGSDFAVFPELLTTQLLSCIDEKRPNAAIRELATYTDRYIEHFTDLALSYNVNILGGTHIVEEDGRLHNVAFLFRRDGTIARQSKLHITPNEHRWWGVEPGARLELIDTDCGKVAIHVCYDIEFPEVCRLAVDAGARILFVPYCTEDRQGHLRVTRCAQARAIENQVYVVTAGTVGNLPESENMDIQYAQSGIYTPSDFSFPREGIAVQADPNVETVIVGDIDLELLRRQRRRGTVMQLRDRRHDLYQVVQKS